MHAEKIVLLTAFLLAVTKLVHIGLPIFKNILKERAAQFIDARMDLQHAMKEARKKYELANMEYFRSFEQKVNWIHKAQEIADEKIAELKAEYVQMMYKLEQQFKQKEQEIEKVAINLKLDRMFKEFEHLICKEKRINLEKILQKH